LNFPRNSGHQESEVYNHFWSCSAWKKTESFTKAFKTEAVRLVVEEGRRVSEVSRELGISEGLLRRWKQRRLFLNISKYFIIDNIAILI